ncbi:MAG: ABC transporter permease subunit [Clostridiaceae bacterium]|nr:ABC transporter permease subunit [Clostridiaceae bacterium]
MKEQTGIRKTPAALPTYAAGKNSRLAVRLRKSLPYYLIILLPVLYLIIFKYAPMYGIQIAFKDYRVSKGFIDSPWVGMKYFESFFNLPSFWTIMFNTLSISLYSLLASFPLAVLLAVALNESRRAWFKKSVQMITYMPYFISTVVLVSMIMQFTDLQSGFVCQLIRFFGGKPQNIMGVADYFKSIYVWSGVWQSTGYSSIIFLSALAGVSMELREAATIDGASKFQRILHIDLPGIAPTIVIQLILNMGYVMSLGFEKIYLMQNNLNLQVSEVISTYVYKIGLINADYSFATAIGFFNSVINLIMLVLCNSLSRRMNQTSLW